MFLSSAENSFLNGMSNGAHNFGTTERHPESKYAFYRAIPEVNRVGALPFAGTPIGTARAVVAVLAALVVVFAIPYFAYSGAKDTVQVARALGFCASWFALGLAEATPIVGTYAHYFFDL